MLLGTVYVHFDGIQLCKQATLAVWIALYDECLKSDFIYTNRFMRDK